MESMVKSGRRWCADCQAPTGLEEDDACSCSAETPAARCSRRSTTARCAARPSSGGWAAPSPWACSATASSCRPRPSWPPCSTSPRSPCATRWPSCASSGLVETRRGRGGGSFVRSRDDALAELADARLAELGTTDLRELGDVHGAVAAAAARLAAARASRTRDRPAARHRRPAGPRRSRSTDQRRADGRFYIELAACAQSVRLTMQEMELHLELGQLPWPPAHVAGAPRRRSSPRHRAVVDAIEARDPARARALTEEHVETRTLWSIELRLRAGAASAAVRGPDPARDRPEVARRRADEVARIGAAVSDVVERRVRHGRPRSGPRRCGPRRRATGGAGRPDLDDARPGPAGARRASSRSGSASSSRPQPGPGPAAAAEWWQVDPDGGRLRALRAGPAPASLGFYDYTATEWFDVPRRTGAAARRRARTSTSTGRAATC